MDGVREETKKKKKKNGDGCKHALATFRKRRITDALTFKRRKGKKKRSMDATTLKEYIKKKTMELSVLHDTKACAIIMGADGKLETSWPENGEKLVDVIKCCWPGKEKGDEEVGSNQVNQNLNLNFLPLTSSAYQTARRTNNIDVFLSLLHQLQACSLILDQVIQERISGMISGPSISDSDGRPRPRPEINAGASRGLPNCSELVKQNQKWVDEVTNLQASGNVVASVMRIDLPVDTYPNFDFIGTLSGPQGRGIFTIQHITKCQVYIKGRGSMGNTLVEESSRRIGGFAYGHLREPMHLWIEGAYPENILDVRLKKAKQMVEEALAPIQIISCKEVRSYVHGSNKKLTTEETELIEKLLKPTEDRL